MDSGGEITITHLRSKKKKTKKQNWKRSQTKNVVLVRPRTSMWRTVPFSEVIVTVTDPLKKPPAGLKDGAAGLVNQRPRLTRNCSKML